MCRCDIMVEVEAGKVVKVKGSRSSSLRSGVPCSKGRALPDILNHPERLTFPLKRHGKRGENNWDRVSWEEALNITASKLNEFKQTLGPESIALGLGDPKGLELVFLQRFASAFGTPNITTPGHLCHMPGELASIYTFGSACVPDEEKSAGCTIVWGNNFPDTHASTISISQLRKALANGGKLILIDPRQTALSPYASLWLKLRPGSDGSLALGMIKVIVEQQLYDREFVDKWTVGFDSLVERVRSYSPEKLEEITWIPWSQIVTAAKLYATSSPASIQWGNALDHTSNSFQTCRAISILRALTANVDILGGDLLVEPPPITRPGHFMLLREFPRKIEKTIGNDFKLAVRSAFVPRQSIVKAILESKPVPIKAVLLFGTNPLLTYPGADETYRALTNLEFLVVSELFMTPTAALADIILPAATCLEFDEVAPFPSADGVVLAYPKVVDPPGECWSDIKIINELAKRLGLGSHFWQRETEALDVILEPSGLSFETFKTKRILQRAKRFRKFEADGFRTPSGKAEIYSSQLSGMGYDPLPSLGIPSPETDEEYPLVMTNAKIAAFCHSAHRNIRRLRRGVPEPIVELNPATAARLGLIQGDLVYIETKAGRTKQKLSLQEKLDTRVAMVSYGWWFPERKDGDLYGWTESNINLLTSSDPPYESGIGSLNLRGLPCKIYKA